MDAPSPLAVSNKERLWLDALKQTAAELDAVGIPYFLDTGTLLGAVRDGTFIPWDNDIDIGILDCRHDDEYFVQFIRGMGKRDFVANRSSTGVGLFSPAQVEVNLKIYQHDGDSLLADYSYDKHDSRLLTFLYNIASGTHVSSHGHSPTYWLKAGLISLRPIWRALFLKPLSRSISHTALVARVSRANLLPLGTVHFYDAEFSAPGDCASYLADRYGPEWKTPVRDYDYTKDDQSIARSRQ